MATELCRLDTCCLVELQLSELFPGRYAKNRFEYIEAEEVRMSVNQLGYKPVAEEEILFYAKATRLDENHWKLGNGHRFLMNPIIKEDERGEIVTYCGPYPDTGNHGYEIGLWRHAGEESFPRICPHPVQLRYCVLGTLVVKQLL